MEIFFVLKAIFLGIVEGLTEFLPVSSTGHLIITQSLIDWKNDDFNKMFSVVIQLGAILAVVCLFWPKIWEKLKGVFRGDKTALRFFGIWIIGCLPAAVLGVLFDDFIDHHLFSVPTVIAALVVGGLLLIGFENWKGDRGRLTRLEDITPRQALLVGVFQCLSLWPGFSRSASTIMGGWLGGFSTALAAEYSFFLAIPIMFGASGWSLRKMDLSSMTEAHWAALILGFLVAFLVAFLVVKAFMRFLRTHRLRGFGYYRLALSGLLLVLLLLKVVH